jgi:aspartyl-tRNA(Asn)/glutamyl-tRNA(Gln) amidotransferase subunit A
MIADPVAAVESCLSAIGTRNGELNALVWVDEAGARAAAAEAAFRHRAGIAASPIDGLPIAVKANVAVKGAPWTAALAPFGDRVAVEDSTIVAQMRRAGAVIVGIANMHEAAFGATTDSPLYGQARNPLDPSRTPGGSSGGSAAAVAAGMAMAAIGTDTMGSVRIPSAYCGVAGFKPSAGRVARTGVEPLSWTLDHVGFHAPSIALCKAMLREAGFDASDPHCVDYGVQERRLDAFQVAVLEPFDDCDPGIAARMTEAARVAASLFGPMRQVSIDADFGRLRRRGLLICEAEFAALRGNTIESFLAMVSPSLRSMIAWGMAQPSVKLADALSFTGVSQEAAHRAFGAADAILLPASPQTAFRIGDEAPINQADYTVFANFAGLPAAVVPMGLAANGMPMGLQILGKRGSDETVLAVAEALEPHVSQISAGGAP